MDYFQVVEVVLFYCALFEILNVFSCFYVALELVDVIFDVFRFVGDRKIKNTTIIPKIECVNTITHPGFIHYLILQTHNKIILCCRLEDQCPRSLTR